jgi:EAL domain-containing protein (putative c-di-GMP-specific phosphodiesterase class I)
VQDIIDNRRFHPVFQPVVNTRTGEIAGYEALTRFDDGRRPDVRVADAHSVGLGSTFEAALAASAVEAARHLPPELWLGLNFSAGAILDGSAADVVTKANRAIVIEITEHAPIESYAAVRTAIRQGGDILISVDDAGAGFASLRHVLELAPDIVKLDIGLIRGIDTDPARQALAAGMCHFGIKTGTTMIAEGVETQAEAAVVRELGVELAQGYLFGKPERLEPATP